MAPDPKAQNLSPSSYNQYRTLNSMKTRVIIPAFNEQNAVGKVIKDIPNELVDEIIVIDNGSTDNTAQEVKDNGATLLQEPKKGYGQACLKGLAYIEAHWQNQTDIVVFIDADYSDYPEQMTKVVTPIVENRADLVIGSRALGQKEHGSMTIPQVFGNWLATNLLKLF